MRRKEEKEGRKEDTRHEEEESIKLKTGMVVSFTEIENKREKASIQGKLSSLLVKMNLRLLWDIYLI